mgnify:CR=1 FL=1
MKTAKARLYRSQTEQITADETEDILAENRHEQKKHILSVKDDSALLSSENSQGGGAYASPK